MSEEARVPGEPPREEGVHTTSEQLVAASKALDDLIQVVAEIAVMPGYTLPHLKANIDLGKDAVVNSISVQDAEAIGNSYNFKQFIEQLITLRTTCIERLQKGKKPGHQIPTSDDLQWAYTFARLELKDDLDAPLRGVPLNEFIEKLQAFIREFILDLKKDVALGNLCNSKDVIRAYDKAIADSWRKAHPVNHHTVVLIQILGTIALTAVPFVVGHSLPGAIALGAFGAIANALTLYLTKY